MMKGKLKRLGRDATIGDIFEWAINFMNIPSSKRFEENIKFIFKLTLKKLKNKMLKRYKITSYCRSFDVQFYNFYFLELARANGLQIEAFHDPLNSRAGSKTLNSAYLTLVFSSTKFREDFLSYITSQEIITDYQTNLDRKVKQLLLKFDDSFGGRDIEQMEIGIERVQHYFRYNRQCKLPWMHSEIQHAVASFRTMVANLLGN